MPVQRLSLFNKEDIRELIERTKKRFYIASYNFFNDCYYRELYTHELITEFKFQKYNKGEFRKFYNVLRRILRLRKKKYLFYRKPHMSVLLCKINAQCYSQGSIKIDLFSEVFFDNQAEEDILYCKNLKEVIKQYMKGVLNPECYLSQSEYKRRIASGEEDQWDIVNDFFNQRKETLVNENKWDDAPGDRMYVEKWSKVCFFMPYARKKSRRKSIVIRAIGPIYPEGAIKLEDYYKDHKDSRPSLTFKV